MSSSGTSEKIEKAVANVRALIDETPKPWRSRWCSYVEQHPTHFDWRNDVKFARLFNDPDPPNFRWTLTKGWIWTPAIRLAEVERLR